MAFTHDQFHAAGMVPVEMDVAERLNHATLPTLGLGMAIVRHLVELHGGSVTAASAGPDNRATFTVALPSSAPTAASGNTAIAPCG